MTKIQSTFENLVDGYIETCKTVGKSAEITPYCRYDELESVLRQVQEGLGIVSRNPTNTIARRTLDRNLKLMVRLNAEIEREIKKEGY